MIIENRLWPVEIMRLKPANPKVVYDKCVSFLLFYYLHLRLCMNACVCVHVAKKNPEIPFHGVSFVDLGQLLYPGVKRTRGAYSIQPFSEEAILEKVRLMHTENVFMWCLWNLSTYKKIWTSLLFILSLKTSKSHSVLQETIKSADSQKGRTTVVSGSRNDSKEVTKMQFPPKKLGMFKLFLGG